MLVFRNNLITVKRFLKNIIILCLSCFCVVPYTIAQDIKYGLEFSSFEVVKDKRTGLNLTPSKPFSFSKSFSLSFDVRFQSDYKFSYGYVFRVIGQNNNHVDFLINKANLIVTHLGKTIANFSFTEIDLAYDTYFPFEIQFDVENNVLNITMKGKRVAVKNVSMKDFKKINIVFGKCDYPRFQVSDIPKMSIKDIRINNDKGLPVYFWPLSKHTQNGVYDELEKQFAHAENPQWILDNHALWKKQVSFDTKYNPQICYNTKEDIVCAFDRDSFFSYDTRMSSLKEESLNRGVPDSYYTNQIVYNPQSNSYYSYFDVGDMVVVYDTLSNAWESVSGERKNAYYLHHNKVISPYDSCLYVFGGYGHHKYNNVISKYVFKTQSWEVLSFNGDHIQPRYLSGLGVIDETKFLLFGGYGSETGAQELSPQNYYDLYIVDIKEKTIRKVWELTPPKDNFVVASSIVVDTLNKCFYALCFPQQQYNTSLSLGKFSMEKSEYEISTNTIPFVFQDILSDVNLFLNKDAGELVAVTSSPVIADSTAIVSIYSLKYPPLAEKDLYQVENDCLFASWAVPITAFCLLLCACGGIVYFRKKKRSVQSIVDPPTDLEYKPESELVIEQEITINKNPVKMPVRKQAILLLGGFRVLNKEGCDITSEFSPLLKQLFLLILLNTLKDGKGVSSLKLRETLWFDKTQESARNNRGVLLSRLRQILEQVGFVNIENRNSFWIVEFGDDIYCDYSEMITLMKQLKEDNNPTSENARKLLSIVAGGEMLQNFQFDWVDSFKADFSNNLTDVLLAILQNPNLKLSSQDNIDLADAIFIHDYLNEDALKLKCRTLISMGKNGLAKGAYNSFIKEYQASFGTNFKYSFEQIVS